MSGPTRPLPELILEEIECRLAELHTGLPAKVVKVRTREDGTVEAVDVQPLLMRGVLDDDMQVTTEEIPIVTRVPYLAPCFGGWILHTAPAVDDLVYLTFAERSLDRWMAGQGQAVLPGVSHKHELADAVAVARFDPWGLKPAARMHAQNLYLGREDGATFIEITRTGDVTIKAATVKLGEGATLGVARQNDEITIDAASDPAFATWLGALSPASVAPYTAPIKGRVSSASGKVSSE